MLLVNIAVFSINNEVVILKHLGWSKCLGCVLGKFIRAMLFQCCLVSLTDELEHVLPPL